MAERSSKSSTKNKKTDLKMIGPNLNFTVKESYKRLRTNLDFALADVQGCRVIGLTSSIHGEGKSLTSINLAYTLSEAGLRVILIEGDMRLPTLARKLHLASKKGLSNVCADSVSVKDVIQCYKSSEKEQLKVEFDILTAGTIPPNPSELLSSQKMEEVFDELKASYDYLIVDLPPVIAVTDALVASKLLHGVVFVIRHDYSEKGALAEAMRQMSFSNIRVLGCVFNCSNEDKEGYLSRYRYKYGRGYYRSGYKSYGYSNAPNGSNTPGDVDREKRT